MTKILTAHGLEHFLLPASTGSFAAAPPSSDSPPASNSLATSSSGSASVAADSDLSSAASSKTASRSTSPSSAFGDATRLLMCMALFGLCIFTGSDTVMAPGTAAAGAGTSASGVHGGARVLSATDMNEADPSLANHVVDAVVYWSVRLLTVFACLVAIFAREPLSEADSAVAKVAQEHEKKAVACVTLGHYPTAKFHAQRVSRKNSGRRAEAKTCCFFAIYLSPCHLLLFFLFFHLRPWRRSIWPRRPALGSNGWRWPGKPLARPCTVCM